MQRRVKLALECAVVVVAIASYWLFASRRPDAPPVPRAAPEATHAPPLAAPAVRVAMRDTAAAKPAGAGAASFAAAPAIDFRSAPDALEYLRAMLPRAQAGDAAAAFEVYATLRYCADGFEHYYLEHRSSL